MKEFFPMIPKIRYEGSSAKNGLAFRYYNPDEVIAGKPMRDHLKFALSYWHTLCADGTDMFGRGTMDKNFSGKTPMEIYENRAYAAFELLDKLNIDYFCFHDRDIAPEGSTLAESNGNLDKIAELLEKLMKEHGKSCCGVRQTVLITQDICTVPEHLRTLMFLPLPPRR